MTANPLDRPVWHALSTRQSHVAVRDGRHDNVSAGASSGIRTSISARVR
jgi:hypothetical protein